MMHQMRLSVVVVALGTFPIITNPCLFGGFSLSCSKEARKRRSGQLLVLLAVGQQFLKVWWPWSPPTGLHGFPGNRDRKAHKLFQHELFGPRPKHPYFGRPEKVYVPHFLGKNAKKGPTRTFSDGFWGSKTESQTGHFEHKNFSLLFFSALKNTIRDKMITDSRSCYSWEFISPKLPLPLPSWNSDGLISLPLPLPSWRP